MDSLTRYLKEEQQQQHQLCQDATNHHSGHAPPGRSIAFALPASLLKIPLTTDDDDDNDNDDDNDQGNNADKKNDKYKSLGKSVAKSVKKQAENTKRKMSLVKQKSRMVIKSAKPWKHKSSGSGLPGAADDSHQATKTLSQVVGSGDPLSAFADDYDDEAGQERLLRISPMGKDCDYKPIRTRGVLERLEEQQSRPPKPFDVNDYSDALLVVEQEQAAAQQHPFTTLTSCEISFPVLMRTISSSPEDSSPSNINSNINSNTTGNDLGNVAETATESSSSNNNSEQRGSVFKALKSKGGNAASKLLASSPWKTTKRKVRRLSMGNMIGAPTPMIVLDDYDYDYDYDDDYAGVDADVATASPSVGFLTKQHRHEQQRLLTNSAPNTSRERLSVEVQRASKMDLMQFAPPLTTTTNSDGDGDDGGTNDDNANGGTDSDKKNKIKKVSILVDGMDTNGSSSNDLKQVVVPKESIAERNHTNDKGRQRRSPTTHRKTTTRRVSRKSATTGSSEKNSTSIKIKKHHPPMIRDLSNSNPAVRRSSIGGGDSVSNNNNGEPSKQKRRDRTTAATTIKTSCRSTDSLPKRREQDRDCGEDKKVCHKTRSRRNNGNGSRATKGGSEVAQRHSPSSDANNAGEDLKEVLVQSDELVATKEDGPGSSLSSRQEHDDNSSIVSKTEGIVDVSSEPFRVLKRKDETKKSRAATEGAHDGPPLCCESTAQKTNTKDRKRRSSSRSRTKKRNDV